MSLNFGKINRSAAFNPTTAFPLDARCYFESYDLAAAAAASAKPAGDTTTTYYHGLTLVVVENNIATLYVIQPDGTLAETGSKIEINEKAFEFNNGKLGLKGFSSAIAGSQAVISSDGELTWVKPDPSTVDGLEMAVTALQEGFANLSEEVGNPATETTKATGLYAVIANEVAKADHLKRLIVDSIDDIDITQPDAEQYIYMVPTFKIGEKNSYDEYLVINQFIEKVGSWEVNLDNYVTNSALSEELLKKVDVVPGFSLVANTEIEKLATIAEGAEKNYLRSVTQEFLVSDAGALSINKIDQSKISGLIEVLSNKVDAIEGKGLSTNDFTDEDKNAIATLQQTVGTLATKEQLDSAIESLQTIVGNLATKEELTNAISGLNDTYVTKTVFTTTVGDITKFLHEDKTETNLVDEILALADRLIWQDME